jgi:hypothetical protein
MSDTTLTPEQIDNWRRTMLGIIGPAAVVLPDEYIQAYRDRMQEIAYELEAAAEGREAGDGK